MKQSKAEMSLKLYTRTLKCVKINRKKPSSIKQEAIILSAKILYSEFVKGKETRERNEKKNNYCNGEK